MMSCVSSALTCLCVYEQEAVKATARTKAHVYRVKTAPNCAAVCLSTPAPHVRLTSVTIVVMASVFPATVSHLQGTSPAGKMHYLLNSNKLTHA